MERGGEFFASVPAVDQCSSLVRLLSLALATLITWVVWRRYLAKDAATDECHSSSSRHSSSMELSDPAMFSTLPPPPCCQVESCGGAAYCNPSYNDEDDDEDGDDDDDDDEDSSSSGDERNLALSSGLYPLEVDDSSSSSSALMLPPRLGFLEPIVEETSDDLRSEESRSEASGRWGWDCSSTDGAPSVIHVTPNPAVTLTAGSDDDDVDVDCSGDNATATVLPPPNGANKDQELDKWLESSMKELEGGKAVVVLVPGGGGGRSGSGSGSGECCSDRFDLDVEDGAGAGTAGALTTVTARRPTSAPPPPPPPSSPEKWRYLPKGDNNQNSHSSSCRQAGGERPDFAVTPATDDDAAGATGALLRHAAAASVGSAAEVTSWSSSPLPHNGYHESERVLKANNNKSVHVQHENKDGGVVVVSKNDCEPQELVRDLNLDNAELLILFENGDNPGIDDSGDDDPYYPSSPTKNAGVGVSPKEAGVELQAHELKSGAFADWNQAIDEYLCSLVASPWRSPPTSDLTGSPIYQNNNNNNNKSSSAGWQHHTNDPFPVISNDVTDRTITSNRDDTTKAHPRSAAIAAAAVYSKARDPHASLNHRHSFDAVEREEEEEEGSTPRDTRHPLAWADHAHHHELNSAALHGATISKSNPNLYTTSPSQVGYQCQQPSLNVSKGVVDNLDLAITRVGGVEVCENFDLAHSYYKTDPVSYDECLAARDHDFDDFDDEENDYDWASSSSDDEGGVRRVQGGGLQQFHGVFEDLSQIAALGDELSSPISDADSDDPGRYYECFNDHVVCGDPSLVRSLSLTDLRSYSSSGDGLHDEGVERGTADGSEGRTRANSGSSEPDTPSAHTTTRPSTENLSEDSGYCDTGSGATVERADSSSPDEEVIGTQQQQRGKYPIGVIPEDEESEDSAPAHGNSGDTMNSSSSPEHEIKVNSARARLEQLLLRDHDRRADVYCDGELSDGRERAVHADRLTDGSTSFKRDFDLLYNSSGGARAGAASRHGNGMVLDDLALESAKANNKKKRQRPSNQSVARKRNITLPTTQDGRFNEFETLDKSSGSGEGWQEALLQREWERSVKSGRAATDDWLIMRAYVPKPPSCLKPTRSADCLMWPVADSSKETWEDDGTDIDSGVLSCPPSFAPKSLEAEVRAALNVKVQPEEELVIVEEGERRGGGVAEEQEEEEEECGNSLGRKMLLPDGIAGGRRSWQDQDPGRHRGGPESGADKRGRRLGDGPSLASGQTHEERGVGARSLPELQTTQVGRQLSRDFGRVCVQARATSAAVEDPATFVSWKEDHHHHYRHGHVSVPAAPHVEPHPIIAIATTTTSSHRPTHPQPSTPATNQMNQAKWLASPATEKRDPLAEVRRVQVSLASRQRPTRPPPPPPHSSCSSAPQPRSDGDVTTAASRVHVMERETPLPSNVQHVAAVSVNSLVAKSSSTSSSNEAINENRDDHYNGGSSINDEDNGETDRAARALEDSFRQLERAISSLEQDIGHVSPHRRSPWPPPEVAHDPFYLHEDESPPPPLAPSSQNAKSAAPLTPSRARIVDARRQFFVASSPTSSTPTSPEPPSPSSPPRSSSSNGVGGRPDDLAAVFDSFRQRAQEGRERVARSVVDLSEIERAVRVQIDSLATTSTLAPLPPCEDPQQQQHEQQQQQTRARAPPSPPRAPVVVRQRSQSASGYLETDVDTLLSREVLHVTENGDSTTTTPPWERDTALFDDRHHHDDDDDDHHHHHHHLYGRHHISTAPTSSSPTKAASMLSLPGDHRPRRYGQPPSPTRTQDEADRARSMEFLLDADNKAAAQPPENALMRGAEPRALSQHELRVRRSLQRLDVPDWFKNSPHSKSGSFLLLKRSPEPTGSRWPSSTVSSRTPSASSLQQQTSPSSATPTPTRPRAPTAPSSTTTATAAITTRVPPPYCWRYPRCSRESLQSPGSPSPSPQPERPGGSFHFPRWGSARISTSSGGAPSTPSPSPTGTLSRPPGLLVHRQPYLGWRSSERLSREVASAHTTPTHFYRSAAERLSAGPGYYALRYGAYGKPGSEGNLLARPTGPPPLKRSPISPSTKPPIPPKPVVSPTSGQYRPAATQPPVTNGYAPSSDREDTPPPPPLAQVQVQPPETCPDESALQSPKSPRQRVIWMESSFVGVKPGKGSPIPIPTPAPASSGSSPNRKTPSPGHDTSPSGGYRSKSSLVSGGSDDIRLTKAKRSFGQIHDEEGSSRDSSSPVATLEEVLDSLLAIPSGGSRSTSPSTRGGAGRFYVADGDSSSDADSRRSSTALMDGESTVVKVDGAPVEFSPPFPPPPRSHSSSSSSCNSEPSSRSGSFSAGRLAQGLADSESPHRLHQHQHCSPPPEAPSAPPLEDCTSPQPSHSPHANDEECETDLGRLAGDEDLADNDVILVDRRGSHPRPPTPPPRSLAPDAASSSPVGAPPNLHHVHWGTLPVTNTSAPAPEGEPGEAGGESGTEEASARRRGSEQLRNLLPDDLLVRCSFPRCAKTVAWAEARRSFKTCHNCYTYYCSRECRRLHWDKHRRTCMYSRVRSLCRHVILHSHDDVSVRAHLSKLARTGVLTQGRGFIKIGFRNPELAERFLQNGWSALEDNPIYMAWRDLLPQEFGADIYHEMSEMCKSYNPEVKFILLVAVYVTREIPAQPVPRWEREIIAKCAKMPLRKPGGPSGDEYGDPSLEPDTLILTAVPAPTTDLQASPRQARHHCFTNIQRHLGQRGVSLRHQFPDVFDKLSNYVERDELFPPITIYPKDGRTGKTFMCLIMASTEPEIEAVVRDFARKT